MKSEKPMSEEEVDRNLVDSFPASDPPSWTVGTDHQAAIRDEENRRDFPRVVFHQLARFFNGLHWAVGMTTLPETATAREERNFVLMWIGIVVFVIVFFAGFIYLLTW